MVTSSNSDRQVHFCQHEDTMSWLLCRDSYLLSWSPLATLYCKPHPAVAFKRNVRALTILFSCSAAESAASETPSQSIMYPFADTSNYQALTARSSVSAVIGVSCSTRLDSNGVSAPCTLCLRLPFCSALLFKSVGACKRTCTGGTLLWAHLHAGLLYRNVNATCRHVKTPHPVKQEQRL